MASVDKKILKWRGTRAQFNTTKHDQMLGFVHDEGVIAYIDADGLSTEYTFSNDDLVMLLDGTNAMTGDLDMGTTGNRIDLDTDNDTSIRATADDVITIEVAGSDLYKFDATSFYVNSIADYSGAGLVIDPAIICEINSGENDVDFVVNANGMSNALFVQGSDGYVGIGTTPSAQLHVLAATATGAAALGADDYVVLDNDDNMIINLRTSTLGVTNSSGFVCSDDTRARASMIYYHRVSDAIADYWKIASAGVASRWTSDGINLNGDADNDAALDITSGPTGFTNVNLGKGIKLPRTYVAYWDDGTHPQFWFIGERDAGTTNGLYFGYSIAEDNSQDAVYEMTLEPGKVTLGNATNNTPEIQFTDGILTTAYIQGISGSDLVLNSDDGLSDRCYIYMHNSGGIRFGSKYHTPAAQTTYGWQFYSDGAAGCNVTNPGLLAIETVQATDDVGFHLRQNSVDMFYLHWDDANARNEIESATRSNSVGLPIYIKAGDVSSGAFAAGDLYLYAGDNMVESAAGGDVNIKAGIGAVNGEIIFNVNSATAGKIESTAILMMESSLKLKEQAAAPSDTAAYGQLWVKDTTPCQLWFTDDAGADTQIA